MIVKNLGYEVRLGKTKDVFWKRSILFVFVALNEVSKRQQFETERKKKLCFTEIIQETSLQRTGKVTSQVGEGLNVLFVVSNYSVS